MIGAMILLEMTFLLLQSPFAIATEESKIVSFGLSPTAELSFSSDDAHRRRRLSNNEKEDKWEYRHGIYGALERFSNDDWKKEFDASRQYSRFEQHYRESEHKKETKQRRALSLTNNYNSNNYNSNNDNQHRHTQENHNPYQLTPLFQGYGTHYSTVWVGSPPQRKSVIVDTGSHYTAFPCVGCNNCGEEHHTDPYFDSSKSSTFRALTCSECQATTCNSNGRCIFSQSYTEGSSWSAYQVQDRFFCGSSDRPNDPTDNSFAIDFMFGCQTSETGLFVTQLADGIMGMSAHPATLPHKMYTQKKIPHNMFTLCFKRELAVSKDGVLAGFLTLGGVDTRLNSSPMVYAQNKADSGWYTVNVKNIFLRRGGGISSKMDTLGSNINAEIIHLPMNAKVINSGKGVIVDSGTTDTYLSKSLQKSFYSVWKSLTGMNYSNSALKLSLEQIQKLPTILIQLEAYDGMGNKELMSMEQHAGTSVIGLVGKLDVTSPRDVLLAVPAENFFEYSPSRDTYTSRLYFTESRYAIGILDEIFDLTMI